MWVTTVGWVHRYGLGFRTHGVYLAVQLEQQLLVRRGRE